MATNYKFKIVTQSEIFCDLLVTSLVIPGSEGSFGVLTNHAPIISSVDTGILKVTDHEGKESNIQVGSGYFDMIDNNATLITEHAKYIED